MMARGRDGAPLAPFLRRCRTAMMVGLSALKNFTHWLPSDGLGRDALLSFFHGRSTSLHADPAALMTFVP
jgi:ABC-type dipeptide/oligopeptide/nickel transport system permease subunit